MTTSVGRARLSQRIPPHRRRASWTGANLPVADSRHARARIGALSRGPCARRRMRCGRAARLSGMDRAALIESGHRASSETCPRSCAGEAGTARGARSCNSRTARVSRAPQRIRAATARPGARRSTRDRRRCRSTQCRRRSPLAGRAPTGPAVAHGAGRSGCPPRPRRSNHRVRVDGLGGLRLPASTLWGRRLVPGFDGSSPKSHRRRAHGPIAWRARGCLPSAHPGMLVR